MMTVFQILRKYGASFEIDDSIGNSLYAKGVGMLRQPGQFRLKPTVRIYPACCPGRDDILLFGEAADE